MNGGRLARLSRPALAGLVLLISAAGETAQPPTDDPVIARVLGAEIRASQRDRLSGLVLGPLFDKYRRDRAIEATPGEIDHFVAKSEEQQAKMREEWRVQSAELERRLVSEEYAPEERESLDKHLATLRQLLEPDPEMDRWGRENAEQHRAIQENVARQTIVGWKTNKALHDEYGGRVIFQQAGPEPVDAYRQFLEEQRAAGAFEILGPIDREAFWHYFVNDRMHAFMDLDGAEIFATPWWLLDRPLGEPPGEN